jgi:hypothetical protein
LLASPAFTTQRSLLVLTFDEDDQSDGNHIPTILVGSGITPGTQSSAPYTHYSVLKTIETAWSLPPLTANDAAAQPIADIFSTSTTTDPTSSAPTTTTVSATIAARGPASAAAWTSDSTTNLTLPVPAGAQPGDVLVASLGFGKSSATTQPTLTAPPGWALVRRTNMGSIAAMAVYTHVFAPGENSFTWTTNVTVGAAVFMAAYSGVNAASPVEVSAGASVASAAGTSIVAPSVTTTTANDMLVASYYGWRNGGRGTTWLAPVGMTELGDATTTTSRSGTLDGALQPGAGASGAKTATASAAQDHVVTTLIALKPA